MASQVSRCPELSKQCLCFHIPFLRWSHRLSLARQLYHRTLNSRLYFGVHHRLFGADGVTKPIPQLSLQHPSVRTFVAIVSAAPSVHPSARPRFRRLIAWVPFSGRQPTYQPTQEPSRWTQWRKAVKTRIKARRKWLKLGLQNSVMLSAAEASSTMDENALSWTLTVLDDDREFEDFVARVPGFFRIPHRRPPQDLRTRHLASHGAIAQEQTAHLHEDPLVLCERIQPAREHKYLTILCPHRLRKPRDDSPVPVRRGPYCVPDRTQFQLPH